MVGVEVGYELVWDGGELYAFGGAGVLELGESARPARVYEEQGAARAIGEHIKVSGTIAYVYDVYGVSSCSLYRASAWMHKARRATRTLGAV